MFLAYWVHDLSPFLVRFTDTVGIRYYGLAYLLGFATAAGLLALYARKGRSKLTDNQIGDLMVAIVFGVLLGGRIGYFLLYQPGALIADPLVFFRVWDGGMASHGGFVGVGVAIAWFARSQKIPFLHLADLIASTAAAGLLFGRVANFINGELLGKIVAAPGEPAPWWSVKFPQELVSGHEPPLTDAQQQQLGDLIARVAKPNDDGYLATSRLIDAVQHGAPSIRGPIKQALEPLLSARHPSQLYQAFFEGVVLTVVLWIIARKPHLTGMVAAAFLGVYGVLRVIAEFFRLPDAQFGAAARIAGLSRGQWLSVLMVAVGVAAFVYLRKVRSPINPGWATK
jgi:phosphatidylglycerol:prolipoprotein diacylglycerol transferase